MTENELRTVLKVNGGWSLSKKMIDTHYYLYAAKRQGMGNKLKEVYLCAAKKLVEKSEQDIIARIESALQRTRQSDDTTL